MRKSILAIAFCIINTVLIAQPARHWSGGCHSGGEKKMIQEEPVNFISGSLLDPLTIAPDFTVTFTDGSSAKLYNTCDSGNSVVLDFFYTTCTYCIFYAPVIDSAYQAHGAGTGNIKFWGIDYSNSNAEVDAYKALYGITNPCVSGLEGNGDYVCGLYQVSGYPKYAVVCPDKTLFFDVNYPPVITGFNAYFDTCGTSSIGENPAPGKTRITYLYPVPAQDDINVHLYIDRYSQVKIELYDMFGKCHYSAASSANKGYYNSVIPVSRLRDGTYIIKVLQDEQIKDIHKIVVMK